MAEITPKSDSNKSLRVKRKSTRIDMTAMVDVAFLLLTFFVLTAAMANSSTMDMVLPPKNDPNPSQDVDEEKVLTLILGAKDSVFWYEGQGKAGVHLAHLSTSSTRNVLLAHLKKHVALCKETNNAPGCWDPIFVVKPRWNTKYRNVVDMLDEIAIVKAPKYAITKFSPEDSLLIQSNFHKD